MKTSKTGLWTCLLAVAGLVGCASAPPPGAGKTEAPERYTDALEAIEQGDRALGRAELIRVLEYCGTSILGERIAISLMTDALDPEHSDPDFAAKLAHAYLSQPYRSAWAEQVATSTYLVARNLGGEVEGEEPIFPSADPEDLPDECREDPTVPNWREPVEIPELSAPSISGRVGDLERTVAELQAELDRVRETLRP
ncbi:MAG: hypothetical protein M8860_05495 [marine benthic group bacterium]|jgi:hypothetical protein|nr:hypothetical protein [Candidatus Carthagonibacter metallireducens]MCL7967053.1 hypothetical protein [Gemmatimonadota bacterium]MCL7969584.1 hypothetical protein [Gemmatimonadota bacterium]MCL7977356.1 hypothetical protein [Gemmatimonadota bacterium]MCL7980294.1 hypothetical protein [Gemmatimonadota bacterium]